MNQQQRKFLITKIQESVKMKIRAIRDAVPEEPKIREFIKRDILNGSFEIIPNDQIKKMISRMTDPNLKIKGRSFSDYSDEIAFELKKLFIEPKDFKKIYSEYSMALKKADDEINKLNLQTESLIIRIQLASDKTLQQMISDVDDMGNISLMDTSLKQLTQ